MGRVARLSQEKKTPKYTQLETQTTPEMAITLHFSLMNTQEKAWLYLDSVFI